MAEGGVKIRITGDDSQFEATLKGLQGKTSKILGGVGKAAGIAAKAIGAVSLAAGAAAGSALSVGMEFEASMSTVAATAGISGEALDRLTAKAKEMGAETQFSASQAAEAMNYMAMAGWKTEDMLGGIEGIMSLAAASGEDLATTSDIVTDALTAFGMTAQDSGRFADILAAASSNANTNVAMMGETFKYVAPLAGALGYEAEDMAVAIGLMANAGIKGSQSGTALRGLMTRLSKPTKESSEAMKALDLSMTNADGTMKPFMQVIEEMRDRFSGLGEAEKAQYAAMLAGQEGMSGLLAVVNASEADFEKLTGAITNCEGAAQSMAETRMDNLAGDVKILQSAFEGLQISIAESSTGIARDMVQSVTEMLSAMNEAYAAGGIDGMLNAFAKQFPKLVTKVITVLEKLVAEVTRKLPETLKQMVAALPNILEALLTDLPAIVESIFAVITSVAEQIVSDLPKLVPMLLQGVLHLAEAVVNGVASSARKIAGSLLEALFGNGTPDIEDAWNKLVDQDIVLKMTSIEVEAPEPIDTSKTESVIRTAYNNIYNALNTPVLTDAQQEEITLMIGSGYRAIYDKLIEFGLPESRAAELAQNITDAYDSIATTLETTSLLSPDQIAAVQGVVENGYQAVYDMLIGFGLPAGTADQIAARVTLAYQSAAGAVEGCTYLDAGQKATIMGMIGGDYETIYNTLLGFGVPEGTAAEIAGKVSGAYDAIASEITALTLLTPDQQKTILDMIGGTYEEIYNKLVEFGMDPVQAAAVAHDIVTIYGLINSGLRTPILTETQQEAVINAIDGGYEAVYNALIDTGFDPTEAAAAAKTITDSYNEIVKAFGEIDTTAFGISDQDLAKIWIQSQGSKVKLIAKLREAGLKPEEIAAITAVWDENVASVTAETPNMIAAIYDALTDGDMSTDDQTLLNNMKDSAIAADLQAVEDWLNEEIAKIDPNDPQYSTKIAALHTQADEWKREIMSVDTEMTNLISELAGQPTQVVQQRLAEFEALERRANALAARLDEVNAAGREQGQSAYERTVSGTTTDVTKIATAQSSSRMTFDKQMEEAEKARDEMLAAATSVDTEEAIRAWFNEQKNAISAEYANRSGEITEGVLQAFSGLEGNEWIEQLRSGYSLQDMISQYTDVVMQEGHDSEAAQALKAQIQQMFGEAFNLDASEMGINQISEQLPAMMAQALAGAEGNAELASVLEALIQMGILDGIEGINPEEMGIADMLELILTGGIGNVPEPEIEINPDVKLDENGNIVEKTSEELKEELSGGIEAEAPAEVTADDITVTTSEGSSIEAAATAELKKQQMGVDVTADVTLNVNVTDSNATSVGTQVGIDLGNAVKDGVNSTSEAVNTAMKTLASGAGTAAKSTDAYQKAQSAGEFVMSGFKAGLKKKESEIIKQVREFCEGVAQTMANALEERSPSRVTMRIGRYAGEGFEIGIRESMEKAVQTAESVVSGMNLNTRVLPDFESAIQGAVTSVYAAEGGRPIYLNMNGKTVARVLTKDMQQVTNNANRRVGLGVGK